jgi:hypothetical protein
MQSFNTLFSPTPSIEGVYTLIEGSYIYKNHGLAFKSKIEKSYIVIEKLDEKNFGYYYITKLHGISTQSYFGGFTYREGKFFQRIIDYQRGGSILRDNLTLNKENDILQLMVKTMDGKRVMIWKKQTQIKIADKALYTALKEEEKVYKTLYKEKLYPAQHLSMR